MPWQDKIRNPRCKLCSLHRDAEFVCLMGTGTRQAKIMIVGEAPGEREDEEHAAFVGRAGELLTQLLQGAGLRRQDVYITNGVKCRPPGNRTPSDEEVKTCSATYLSKEIRKVQPEWILLLGNSALTALGRRKGITKQRGNAWWSEEYSANVFATFHPAYALRSPQHLPLVQADFQRFARLTKGQGSSTLRTRIKSINTRTKLQWLRRHLMEASEITWDVEAGPYDKTTKDYVPYWHSDFFLVSIAFSTEEGVSYVVPLHHSESPWKDPVAVLRFLKPCLERPGAKYIAHNGPYDVKATAGYGRVYIRYTFDTMFAAHMLDENRLKGLKPLSEVELGADGYDLDKEKKRDLYSLPWKVVARYNGLDTDYEHRLYHHFRRQLQDPQEKRTARVFVKLMMPASNMLAKVETTGVWMDPDRLRDRTAATHRQLARIRSYLHRRAGAPPGINPNSPQQVGQWLFGDLGLPIIELSPKSGNPSTREAVVLRLAREYPQVRALLLWRKWYKFESTYLRPWAAKRDANSRFHPSYKPHGTVTGRLSGDFQQVPRDPFIRTIVGAPPGWKLLKADYSQVELRIAAMLANERNMLRVFHEGGDIHLATAVALTRKRAQDITKEERKKAKAVNFGFLYGMGWKKFIAYAFENYGVIVDEAEARAFRDRYFEMWPALPAWHAKQRRLVNKYGYVASPIGRIRHLPGVQSGDEGIRAEAERQAINSPVQSFASDLMLLSMVRLDALYPRNKARLVATIHDEILSEIRDDYVDEAAQLVKSTMEDLSEVKRVFGTDVTVPIVAELECRQHWADETEPDLLADV